MKLTDPFPEKDLIYKVQKSGIKGDDPWALLSVFVAPYAILDRLDECLPGWGDEYVKYEEHWECEITSLTEGNVFSHKRSGISYDSHYQAFNRAAMKWGIGRYLYQLSYPMFAHFMFVDHGQGGCLETVIADKRYYYLPAKLPMWDLCVEEKEKRRKLTRSLTKKEQQEKLAKEKTNG